MISQEAPRNDRGLEERVEQQTLRDDQYHLLRNNVHTIPDTLDFLEDCVPTVD
jgi:hypothetical protein